MEIIELPPRPDSILESLRDIGYSIETAIADILDNSITAKSSIIDLRHNWNDGNPWIAIIDNGHGMNLNELKKAMLFGSQSPSVIRDSSDLGRFGLGLKTASFSQCRRLTVVTKKPESSCYMAEWDLDKIITSSDPKWLIEIGEYKEGSDKSIDTVVSQFNDNNSSGTVVFWRKLDRLDEGGIKLSKEQRYNQMFAGLFEHIGLTYHRFIIANYDSGAGRVQFKINNEIVEAKDPFNLGRSKELNAEIIGYKGSKITIQPYVLPHHTNISVEEWKKYSGSNGYSNEQGFYVYRNRRLIIKGTWFRLLAKEELYKLIRVRIDIPNELDAEWRIDVKKSIAFPPTGIRDELKRIIDKIAESGSRVYKKRANRLYDNSQIPFWIRVAQTGEIAYLIDNQHPLISKFSSNLTVHQQKGLLVLLKLISASFPKESLYTDMATSPEQLEGSDKNIEMIKNLFSECIKNPGLYGGLKKRDLLTMEPFCNYINELDLMSGESDE